MAVTPRKGDAASVRRQSRQRLRSERRYRRNRFLPFLSAALYELEVPSRDCHVGRWPPRNDNSGAFTILTMACTSRAVPRREGHAPPLQWRVQSPRVPGNLQLPMALTPRKGDAASVRRQSRQRLRSDRRYRRNRFLRFYRHLVRTGSAFPRLPRRPAASSQ